MTLRIFFFDQFWQNNFVLHMTSLLSIAFDCLRLLEIHLHPISWATGRRRNLTLACNRTLHSPSHGRLCTHGENGKEEKPRNARTFLATSKCTLAVVLVRSADEQMFQTLALIERRRRAIRSKARSAGGNCTVLQMLNSLCMPNWPSLLVEQRWSL